MTRFEYMGEKSLVTKEGDMWWDHTKKHALKALWVEDKLDQCTKIKIEVKFFKSVLDK